MYFGIGHPEFGLFPSHWGRQAGCETFAVLTGSSGSVVGRIDAGLTQPFECAAPGLDPCRAVPTLVIEGVVSTGHHRCSCASTRSSSPPTRNTSCRPSSSASRSGRSSCTGWPPAAPRAITASTTTTSGASTWRADPIPSWLEPLRARCAALRGVRPRGAPGGAGPALPARRRIGWHRDAPSFGLVVDVSLGAGAHLRFRRGSTICWTTWEIHLPPAVGLRAGRRGARPVAARDLPDVGAPLLDHLPDAAAASVSHRRLRNSCR